MASPRINGHRSYIDSSGIAHSGVGPSLGARLRNKAWTDDETPGLPDRDTPVDKKKPDGANDEDEDDDRGPKTCSKCDYVNQNSSKYCSKCGTKLDKGSDASARTSHAKSRLLVQMAESIDATNRKLDGIERSRSHAFDMPDLSIFSAKELKALHLGPQGNGLVDMGGGRKELGLLNPTQAQAVLDGLEGSNKASRRGRR